MFQIFSRKPTIPRYSEVIYLAWKEARPEITDTDAKLLASVGDVTLKIHALPLPLIIYIANFLYPKSDAEESKRSRLCEWLIFAALYRQVYGSVAEAEIPLLESAIKESETAAIESAEEISGQLTVDNARQLILMAQLGTDAQRIRILYHLSSALYVQYLRCRTNYSENNEKYQKSYLQTRRYFYFIKRYYQPSFERLKSKPNKTRFENTVINDYRRYMSCARETLRDFAPKSLFSLFSSSMPGHSFLKRPAP